MAADTLLGKLFQISRLRITVRVGLLSALNNTRKSHYHVTFTQAFHHNPIDFIADHHFHQLINRLFILSDQFVSWKLRKYSPSPYFSHVNPLNPYHGLLSRSEDSYMRFENPYRRRAIEALVAIAYCLDILRCISAKWTSSNVWCLRNCWLLGIVAELFERHLKMKSKTTEVLNTRYTRFYATIQSV
jgi:hypothetical protein